LRLKCPKTRPRHEPAPATLDDLQTPALDAPARRAGLILEPLTSQNGRSGALQVGKGLHEAAVWFHGIAGTGDGCALAISAAAPFSCFRAYSRSSSASALVNVTVRVG